MNLNLEFSQNKEVRLESITRDGLVIERGGTGELSFMWSSGVRALCYVLLRASITDPCQQFELTNEGPVNSLRSSLEGAFKKETNRWVRDVLGDAASEIFTFQTRAHKGSNIYVLGLNYDVLTPSSIQITLNGRKQFAEDIIHLSDQILKKAKWLGPSIEIRTRNTPPPPLKLTGLCNSFRFITFSGVSSAGKDTILASVCESIPSATILKKYTTRPERNREWNYCSAGIDEDEFWKLVQLGKIIFPYEKRDYFYGFDADEFKDAALFGRHLFAVFTHFTEVPKCQIQLKSLKVKTQSYFIEVPEEVAVRRARIRFDISHTERHQRVASIQQDFEDLKSLNLDENYIRVQNLEYQAGIEDTRRAIIPSLKQFLTNEQ